MFRVILSVACIALVRGIPIPCCPPGPACANPCPPPMLPPPPPCCAPGPACMNPCPPPMPPPMPLPPPCCAPGPACANPCPPPLPLPPPPPPPCCMPGPSCMNPCPPPPPPPPCCMPGPACANPCPPPMPMDGCCMPGPDCYNPCAPPAPQAPAQPPPKAYAPYPGEITIKLRQPWKPELLDHNSPAYNILSGNVANAVKAVVGENAMVDNIYFREGEVPGNPKTIPVTIAHFKVNGGSDSASLLQQDAVRNQGKLGDGLVVYTDSFSAW